jgi:hypothetical protein
MRSRIRTVWLDYGGAAKPREILQNLSAIAWAEPHLWTAADEGRTIECLTPTRNGYQLHRQISLDEAFPDLPGKDASDEIDVESIDVAHGRIWVCGSHCIVRRQAKKTNSNRIDPRFRVRKSRCLLGSVAVESLFAGDTGEALPFSGKGSLRQLLARSSYIAPFIDLPSKENGLDIEGLVVVQRKVFLGLRAPLIDSFAIVVELSLGRGLGITRGLSSLHFLDLEGLGIRDLAKWHDGILILAGPVSSVKGPFRLHRWQVRKTNRIQRPQCIYEWPASDGAPEGICLCQNGLLVVYDVGNDPARVEGNRFRADCITDI